MELLDSQNWYIVQEGAQGGVVREDLEVKLGISEV